MAPFIVDFFRRLEQGNSKTREILATKSREILIDIASRGRNVNRERGCALRSWSRFLPHRGRVFVRVHKQTCCYRPSPPLSLSRIGADFYRRGDSRGKFIKPPPPLPSVGTQQRALSRESRGEGEERLFHSHSPIKIVRTSILPRAIRPLPFFFLVPLIDKEFVRVGRYGKTARSAFESSYVATW